MQLNDYLHYLAPRPRDSHKGNFGHVLVVGGSSGFAGAAQMSALAASRVGAGLVSIAADVTTAPYMNALHPELMCHGIGDAQALTDLLSKATVVVLGPGLGLSAWSLNLWQAVMESHLPLVVDADALNLLAIHPRQRENWVLTPHPGEAGRLLHSSTEAVQKDREQALHHLVHQYQGTIVLKGSGTLIGHAGDENVKCEAGNPGMATGGMGDILSGVIAGLIAQSIPLGDAARLGVILHATAGDMAAKDGERGMMATDLLPYLRQLSNP